MKIKIKRPKWLPLWLNLPFLLFLAFITMLLFFGEYNYMEISKQKSEINKLNAQIKSKEDSAMYYEKNSDNSTPTPRTLRNWHASNIA